MNHRRLRSCSLIPPSGKVSSETRAVSSWTAFLMDWNDQADGPRKPAFFQPFFFIPGEVFLALGIAMAFQTARRRVLGSHNPKRRPPFIHNRSAVFLAFGIGGVGKHLQHFRFEVVRLVGRKSIIDRGQLQSDACFLQKLFACLSSPGRWDHPLTANALLVDYPLRLPSQ